jgi:hypothetical protein
MEMVEGQTIGKSGRIGLDPIAAEMQDLASASSALPPMSRGLLAFALALILAGGAGRRDDAALAQSSQAPGRSIGAISTDGDLIVLTLEEDVLGRANLFDLAGRTLRFTPGAGGYRAENQPLAWDPVFGAEMSGPAATLKSFTFPFSGQTWTQLSIGLTGSISFGPAPTGRGAAPGAGGAGAGGGRGGGVSIGRFDELQNAARTLVNTVPAICVFFKPRMSGTRYLKELPDRVVVTWSLTEPVGGIQDFTWAPTVNRFQAVLHMSGAVDLSYEQVAAKDAIVGLYPMATDVGSPRVDLSALTPQDGPFPVVYEPFHYLALPNPRDLTCTVIKALGDKFDFLAYYSDFRVDNQEAGTPSTGPRGGGPDGGAVTGIGAAERSVASYCSNGRFQWQFVQPVYIGSNQGQIRPPDDVTDTNIRNIAAYRRQIGERTPDGRLLPYGYAMSQIAHEMGHRWSAFASARVNGEVIPLGPTHWARGLHAPAAFPYQRPYEASAMGGGVWQDNLDGTFTQLDDDYYVPATGWSHLELYFMGLIAASEVPDFFILRNLAPAGRDANGRPIFKADRTKVTIQDVIAIEGPRQPDVDRAQKQFNTGIVVIVEHGKTPSRALIERANGIREQWIDYFRTTTGHRASMTATPR